MLEAVSSAETQRVLVYRLGSLGDHVVALPAYRMVRRAFPRADVRLLTNIPVAAKAAAAEAVLRGSGLVDSFEPYTVGLRNPLALLKLVFRIRRWKPQALVYLAGARGLESTRRDRIFFRVCGISRQVGLPLTEDQQSNRLLRTEPDGTPIYEAEAHRLCRNIAELGDAHLEDPANWTLNLSAGERADAAALLAPLAGATFLAFSIGAKAQTNHWGETKWSELFASLGKDFPGHALVLLGAPDEAALSERVAEAWQSGPVLNLCGTSSPRVSAAVLERARMFFGHDSGPSHLAASTGIPLLQIRSARNIPGQWFPHGERSRVLMHWVECGGCQLDVCIAEGNKCLVSITVPEALAEVQQLSRSA